jgi:Flp pilus assembly protein TadG
MRTDRRARRRGAMLAEAAIVFPILLMITLGAIKYGWLFLRAQEITNTARQAARLAILPDSTLSQVETAIDAYMTRAGMSAYTVDPPLTSVAGPTVTVGIRVDPNTVDLIPGYLPNPASLYASVTMAKEGVPAWPTTP